MTNLEAKAMQLYNMKNVYAAIGNKKKYEEISKELEKILTEIEQKGKKQCLKTKEATQSQKRN